MFHNCFVSRFEQETPTKNLHAKKVIPNPISSCAGNNEADNYFILIDFSIRNFFLRKLVFVQSVWQIM